MRPLLIIPAFNEAEHLPVVLAAVAEADLGIDVAVIDDGSCDATAAVAAQAGARVIRHPFNLGYGAALQTGCKYAVQSGASVLVQMDADGQHDPRDIPRLIDPIVVGECDLMLGSRFASPTGYLMSPLQRVGREVFRLLASLSGLAVTDPTSGFQAMSRQVLELYVGDFYPHDYPDVDVLLAAHRTGLRVRECAVTMSTGPRASSLHGGFRAVYYVYKMMLSIFAASTANPARAA